jgi:tetratricopeptide (TPR) repeat protein
LRYGRSVRRWHDGYGYYSPHCGDLRSAYERGRYDADHNYIWFIAAARAGRLLNQSRLKFDEGILMFRAGRYDRAAINMIGAAEKNHADAASRLHAGHALFALGRYDEATAMLARSFELRPSLAHQDYDIRDEYGDKTDFEAHLAALRAHVAARPNDAGAVTLLGYVTFYSEGPGAAYPYLYEASRLDRKSYFIPKLLTLSRMASGYVEKKEPQPSPAGHLRESRQISPSQSSTNVRQVRASTRL